MIIIPANHMKCSIPLFCNDHPNNTKQYNIITDYVIQQNIHLGYIIIDIAEVKYRDDI